MFGHTRALWQRDRIRTCLPWNRLPQHLPAACCPTVIPPSPLMLPPLSFPLRPHLLHARPRSKLWLPLLLWPPLWLWLALLRPHHARLEQQLRSRKGRVQRRVGLAMVWCALSTCVGVPCARTWSGHARSALHGCRAVAQPPSFPRQPMAPSHPSPPRSPQPAHRHPSAPHLESCPPESEPVPGSHAPRPPHLQRQRIQVHPLEHPQLGLQLVKARVLGGSRGTCGACSSVCRSAGCSGSGRPSGPLRNDPSCCSCCPAS